MERVQVRACHIEYDKKVTVLVSDVHISEPFEESSMPLSPNPTKYKAIWDTGATNTAITQRVVEACNLKPTGMANIETAKGTMTKPTYLVSVWLPNKVCIPQLRVAETDIKGADVLIGMDLIGQGDFAVTNDGKTSLSFRMPSIECINFVKEQPAMLESGTGETMRKVGRNELCPCGSGKKYKRCCGK